MCDSVNVTHAILSDLFWYGLAAAVIYAMFFSD